MASASGSWRGSYMREDDIERLVRLRRIPSAVVWRAPGEETEPEPQPGERVVFGAHLDRGLGLPASTFFRQFLDHFGLQPHHLPANACVLLSCFVAFMEAYAGLWPDIDRRLFYLKAQTTEGRLRACGAASIYTRPAVENGLTAEDLLCTIAERRVLPLQRRTHKIGHMSGRFDPNRTSKAVLSKAQVASRVNNITKANMPDDWNYGLAPRDRDHPPERLFERQNAEDGDLATRRWTPDHVDPADQAGDQAGDDDLLQAPDLGGQGEHNPPPSPEQQEDEESATSATGPIPAVPLRARPPSTTATSAPRGRSGPASPAPLPPWRRRRRSSAGSSRRRFRSRPGLPSSLPRAAAPGRLRASRRRLCAKGGSRRRSLHRAHLRHRRLRVLRLPQGRLPSPCRWPQRLIAARGSSRLGSRRWTTAGLVFWTQPLGPAGACRLRPEPEPAGLHRPRPEPEPGQAWWCWMRARRGTSGAGDGCAAWAICFARSAATTGADDGEPARQEPARDEPARTEADSRALVRTGAPSAPQQGLHVAKGAMLLHVPSASDSSLGSAGTMEQAWLSADSYEAHLKARAAETAASVAKVEEAGKAVMDRRTTLYNRAVTHYHKAKLDRADLAREETTKGATRLRLLEQNHLTSSTPLGRREEKVEDLSRRLTEVEKQRLALQEEVTAKSTELTATAKRWTDEIGALDRGLAAAFPETQDAALAAVGVARESRRRETGEGSSEYFSMEDYTASMAARVEPITKLGWELRKAVEELVPMLAFESGVGHAPGADMALSFVLSWYNEVDLGQLEFRRAGVEDKLPAEYKAARLARASAIADFVDKALFVADPNPPPSDEDYMEDEEAEDEPEDDPAAGSADAPPAGPSPAAS
ncbi:hypothetical protein QYE76_039399 [Lolium multiflorum]|uniref:Transposase (putative) gypsy type domain-containing protein n=1 Tax=Lolium multiflorum TaxID=4521 RepID=A0AAD8TBD8_LOLMU|nr:hypothetical protein QYE76_039399 [Lolium multiflorum]